MLDYWSEGWESVWIRVPAKCRKCKCLQSSTQFSKSSLMELPRLLFQLLATRGRYSCKFTRVCYIACPCVRYSWLLHLAWSYDCPEPFSNNAGIIIIKKDTKRQEHEATSAVMTDTHTVVLCTESLWFSHRCSPRLWYYCVHRYCFRPVDWGYEAG